MAYYVVDSVSRRDADAIGAIAQIRCWWWSGHCCFGDATRPISLMIVLIMIAVLFEIGLAAGRLMVPKSAPESVALSGYSMTGRATARLLTTDEPTVVVKLGSIYSPITTAI